MSNQRLYRSAVRPFFCCGSQFSLNSISEFIEIPNECTEETEYVDITDDEEEESDLMNALCIEDKVASERIVRRQPLSGCRRKKSENGPEKGTMRKKFFTLKLRGRLHAPKASRKNNEQDRDASSDTKKCVIASYRQKNETGASASCSLGATGSLPMSNDTSQNGTPVRQNTPWSQTDFILLSQRINQRINFDELYPTEDIDEQRIAQRAREMEEGIDVNDVWVHQSPLLGAVGGNLDTFHRPLSRSSSNGRDDFYGELSYPQVGELIKLFLVSLFQ